jgi:hypothetical protein
LTLRHDGVVNELPGRSIIRASLVATAAFAVVMLLGVIAPDTFETLVAVMSLAAFFAGCAVFVVALVAGAERSRTNELGIGGWFFLAGAAPRPVQWRLNGAVAVQSAIALVGASVHPYSRLAFGVLVPLLALAFSGWWGARFGSFPERVVAAPPTRRTPPKSGRGPAPVGKNETHG